MTAEVGDTGTSVGMETAMQNNDNPASSEDAFLGLQAKRPLGSKRDAGRSRPSDITVTESTLLDYGSMHQEIVAGSLQAATPGRRSSSPFAAAGSPGFRRASASPAHLSPATSQIFERDVQESTLAPELSPAIPSHIQTEDHIPPVLDASTDVITNDRLDPEEVEVVTHTMHQPAAMTVAGASTNDSLAALPSMDAHLSVPGQEATDDGGSTYGAVDPMDPKRLSFISFADVVHGEHVETGKELPSHLISPALNGSSHGRSPSPVRSRDSDRLPLTPSMSGSGSVKGHEGSPSPRGGPTSLSPGHGGTQHGEITIQTMRETMEQPGSNDVVPGTPV